MTHYIFQTQLVLGPPLNSEKEQALQQTLRNLNKRLGTNAVEIGHKAKSIATIVTGFPELDIALGGGLPRGLLTEIIGKPTSGATSLALSAMAQTQKAGEVVVYLDLSSTFDPYVASQLGVSVADMLLVRPSTAIESLDILFDVASSNLAGMLVLNPALRFTPADRKQLAAVLRRLRPALARTRCALLMISQPRLTTADLTQIAAIRLMVEHDQWVFEGRDVVGYLTHVTLLKHKLATSNQQLKTVSITFHTSSPGGIP